MQREQRGSATRLGPHVFLEIVLDCCCGFPAEVGWGRGLPMCCSELGWSHIYLELRTFSEGKVRHMTTIDNNRECCQPLDSAA